MDCPFGSTPLLDDEKARISSEFLTIILNAEKALAKIKKNTKEKYPRLKYGMNYFPMKYSTLFEQIFQ